MPEGDGLILDSDEWVAVKEGNKRTRLMGLIKTGVFESFGVFENFDGVAMGKKGS